MVADKITLAEFEAVKQQAELGDAEAQYDVCMCYAGVVKVEGLKENRDLGIVYLKKSADQGYVHSCWLMAGEEKDAGNAREYIHYLRMAASKGSWEAMRDYGFAFFSEQYKSYCNFGDALDFSIRGDQEDNIACTLNACILCAMKVVAELEQDLLERALETYKLHKKYKSKLFQSSEVNAEMRLLVSEESLTMGLHMYDAAMSYLERGQDRQFVKLMECSSEVDGNSKIMYALHILDRAEKESENFKVEKYKKCRAMLLDALDMDKVTDFNKGQAFAILALMNREGVDEPANINMAHEYDVMGAKLGNEISITNLTFYKKKLFGGYAFKVPKN